MIKICISTCKEYSSVTIPILLESLFKNEIKEDDILIVEGNNESESIENKNNLTTVKANHNSFELTSLIEVCEKNIYSEKWLLLHDTCVVGPNFKNKLNEIKDKFINYDRIALKPFPSMSIGLYDFKFLLKYKDLLLKYKNPITKNIEETKKAKGVAFKSEDVLLWKLNEGNIDVMGYNQEFQNFDQDIWKTEILKNRFQEYYPQLDLYKLKANNQGGKCVVTLN